VKATSGSPVAYVNIWVPSQSFDEAYPPQFLIQQNEIPVPINSSSNNTALNYFTKKLQGGSVTLMQLVVPLTPNQETYVAVYFSYSLIPNNNNNNTGNNTNPNNNSTNPINGGNNSTNTTNPINGGGGNNSTNNSTNPINGGGGNNSTNNSTTPINGGNNSTNTTNPINGGGGNNSTNNSTTPINGGGNNSTNVTMLKVGATGPVSFNLSAWITS